MKDRLERIDPNLSIGLEELEKIIEINRIKCEEILWAKQFDKPYVFMVGENQDNMKKLYQVLKNMDINISQKVNEEMEKTLHKLKSISVLSIGVIIVFSIGVLCILSIYVISLQRSLSNITQKVNEISCFQLDSIIKDKKTIIKRLFSDEITEIDISIEKMGYELISIIQVLKDSVKELQHVDTHLDEKAIKTKRGFDKINKNLDDAGSAKAVITNEGTNPWDVILFQPNIKLENDKSCIVSFKGRADIEKTIRLITSDANYAEYFNHNSLLTATMKEYSFEFTVDKDTSDQLEFKVFMGAKIN